MGYKGSAATGLVCLGLVFAAAGAFFRPAARPGAASPLSDTPRGAAAEPWQGPELASDQTLRLLLPDGQVALVGLEDYVYGVVCAEMPASFAPAALEAQAVAARTYALRRAGSGLHAPDAQVCADPACCQAYTAQDPANWGVMAAVYGPKIRSAVAATAGEVLTQNGALIDAVFHASSSGATAPAQAVWGAEVPYLVSVSTPETVENVPGLQEERVFSAQEVEALLGSADLGEPVYSDWGGVSALPVGDKTLSGQEVRQKLGLRSARFRVSRSGDSFTFTTVGYGHGVGMSQQGANLLAREGAGYREILAHYYPGTTLEKIS